MEATTAPRVLPPPAWRTNLATIAALMVRAKNELVRVPGAAIPGVLAPTIFFLGLNGVFGGLIHLSGFDTSSYESFIVPVSMLQGAGFTGAAAGVNLARDYEQGWVDRLLVSPAPRWVLLTGNVLAASARSFVPATFVLAIAFVIGAVASVLGGIITGGLTSAQEFGGDTATTRFSGGGSDPNYLAAMLVPAIALAAGLAVRASALARLALLGATMVMAIGLAATQSRGGLLALAVTFLAALVLLRGRRLAVMAVVLAVIGGSAIFFVQNPAAWQRIHAVQDRGSGSGRTDIWQVALRVAEANPVAGVGLGQFPNVSPQYVLRPGSLRSTSLIVEQGIVVHNVYLQLWAETGLIGLLLFLGIVWTSLRASYRAAKELDAIGDAALAALARSVLLANIGVLAGSFFLSNLLTRQIWLLLAIGPALLVVARTRSAERLRLF
jgi:O-antigen ligase